MGGLFESRDLLLSCAACSAAAYNDRIDFNEFPLPPTFNSIKPLILLPGRDGQCCCWVFRDTRKRCIIAAFRGSDSIHDILQGANFCSVPLYKPFGVGLIQSDVAVHAGFLDYFQSAQGQIAEALLDLAPPDYTVAFTGHSLGGAAATLATLEHHLSVLPHIHHRLYCVTFGSPPTGNTEFVKHFNKTITRSYRFVSGADLTPRIPIPGMHHVRGAVRLHHHLDSPLDIVRHHQMRYYYTGLKNIIHTRSSQRMLKQVV